MKTEYIGAYKVKDGYNGHTTNVFLVFDPDRCAVLEVTPCGYHLASVPKCIDEKEADWMVKNHPLARNRYINTL